MIVTKLKTKSNQKTETCQYKIDTGSDGNLIPIRMYKVIFPCTNITKLSKYIDRKIVLHTYITICACHKRGYTEEP